jgi:hypothetical protein
MTKIRTNFNVIKIIVNTVKVILVANYEAKNPIRKVCNCNINHKKTMTEGFSTV